MSNFRFPDGVEFLGDDGDGHVSFKVSVPTDDDGYFGRECPDCDQQFRIASDDYDALPDDLRLWCVYCGHNDEHSEFITEQQLERVTRAATDYAEQLIGGMLDDTFGGLARRSRGRSSRSVTGRSPSSLFGVLTLADDWRDEFPSIRRACRLQAAPRRARVRWWGRGSMWSSLARIVGRGAGGAAVRGRCSSACLALVNTVMTRSRV